MILDNLIDYDELAKRLHVSPVTLRRWTSQRRIPHVKVGKSVRFDVSEIDAWLNEQRVEARRGLNR